MRTRRSAGAGRWPLVLAVLGLALLLIGALRLVWALAQGGAEQADQEASVIAALLAAAGLAAAVVGWLRNQRRAARFPATAEQLDHAAATLAGAVREQWLREARAQALYDPEPMPVSWRLTPHLADHPDVIDPGGPVVFGGTSDRIGELADAFRALPRRRLVITGGPGTGKTTLAVQLVLALLPPPGQAPSEPVPVLVSLADWDPTVQPRVTEWLADRLTETYPALRAISPHAPAALAEQDRILPVLDGLDEVPADRAAAILTALNASLPGGVVLTSRRPEYRAAITGTGDRLTGAVAIGPRPLTTVQAATYLRHLLPPDPGPGWTAVLTALDDASDPATAPALARVVTTPLGLWLVRAVHLDPHRRDGRDPTALISPTATPTSLRAELLDQLVPALLVARPPASARRRHAPDTPGHPLRRNEPGQVRDVLTAVARQLRDAGTRDWQWWNLLNYTPPTRSDQLLVRARVGAPAGTLLVAPYVVYGVLTGQWLQAFVFLVLGPLLGPMVTHDFVAILLGRRPRGRNRPPKHLDLRLRGRRRDLGRALWTGLRQGLGIGLAATLVLTLALLLGLWLVSNLDIFGIDTVLGGLVLGLAVLGLPLGLAIAASTFIATEDTAARSLSPPQSYRRARTAELADSVLYGVVPGVLVGLFIGYQDGVTAGVLLGSATGLVLPAVSLALRLLFLASAFRRCEVASWRVMDLLDDCHRLGLLRTVGPAYQFRHAEFQDHLAPPGTGPVAPGGPAPDVTTAARA